MSRGFCSFLAKAVFCWSNLHRALAKCVLLNMYSLVFGSAWSILINLVDILFSRGFPCFSALHFRVLFSSSKSVHLHPHNSPILNPVSFSARSIVAIFFACSAD